MTKSTITRERVVALIAEHSYDSALVDALEHLLAAMDSEPNRNPVLAYADSYRDMAKQGVESVPIWSVITDLERNIAPLYRHAQQPVVNYVPLGDSPYDVPYSMPSNLRELIAEEIGILFSDDDAQGVWIACRRAAMLSGDK